MCWVGDGILSATHHHRMQMVSLEGSLMWEAADEHGEEERGFHSCTCRVGDDLVSSAFKDGTLRFRDVSTGELRKTINILSLLRDSGLATDRGGVQDVDRPWNAISTCMISSTPQRLGVLTANSVFSVLDIASWRFVSSHQVKGGDGSMGLFTRSSSAYKMSNMRDIQLMCKISEGVVGAVIGANAVFFDYDTGEVRHSQSGVIMIACVTPGERVAVADDSGKMTIVNCSDGGAWETTHTVVFTKKIRCMRRLSDAAFAVSLGDSVQILRPSTMETLDVVRRGKEGSSTCWIVKRRYIDRYSEDDYRLIERIDDHRFATSGEFMFDDDRVYRKNGIIIWDTPQIVEGDEDDEEQAAKKPRVCTT